jgi:hypothetical protein
MRPNHFGSLFASYALAISGRSRWTAERRTSIVDCSRLSARPRPAERVCLRPEGPERSASLTRTGEDNRPR